MNNIDFGKHISSLLKDYECVVIPNFGAFILKPSTASISGEKIFPPHKNIAFNKSLIQDDGLLTGALMNEGHTYKEAQASVFKFGNSLQFDLKKNTQTNISGIGNFFISERGVLKFKATTTENFDKSTFGYQPIQLHRIHRTVIQEKKKHVEAKRIKTITATEKKSRRKLHRIPLAALVIVLGLIVWTSIGLVNNTTQNQQASFSPISTESTIIQRAQIVKSIQIDNTTITAPKLTDFLDDGLFITHTDSPKGYYAIVGSYASEENAKRKEAILFEEGQDSYILPSENGYYRVGVFLNEGNNILAQYNDFKANTRDTWLLKNQ